MRNADEAQELQVCLNSQNPNIHIELKNYRRDYGTTSLSLLDLTIRIDFDFYAKEAKTTVFLHKESYLPWRQKAAAIRNEQHRITDRNSDNELRNQAALRERLRINSYTAQDLHRVNLSSRRRRSTRTHPENGVHYLDLRYLGEARSSGPSTERESMPGSTGALDVVCPRKQEIR